MELINFESLPLPEPVLKGIREAEFKTCTPIQSKSLPISLTRKDLAGQAQTGTGKTAAFLITLFTRLLENKPEPAPNGKKGPRALILAPTRELARQIENDSKILGKYCGFKSACIIGGVDYEKQRNQIKSGADILIATPGRLIDFYKQRFFSLKRIEVLVVDEADRMFDMGFIQDLRYLFRSCPPYNKRQTLLFSATLNYRVMELCYEHMNNPVKVVIEPEKAVVDKIKQSLFHVGQHEKFSLLLGLLKKEEGKKILIFCNTKIEAEQLEWKLNHNGYNSRQISGDLHQKARIKVLEDFQKGNIYILIATDVASRGLHVNDITHVINYDLPQDAEDYVHRIGRTARAGKKGTAITLCCEDFAQHLERVETYLKKKIPVTWAEEELFLEEKSGQPPAKKRRHSPAPKAKPNSNHRANNRKRPKQKLRSSRARPTS